jgi:hypothetical protein
MLHELLKVNKKHAADLRKIGLRNKVNDQRERLFAIYLSFCVSIANGF